jgi:hypothetical protein
LIKERKKEISWHWIWFSKLDFRREAKGKHGKFDNIWIGHFEVVAVQDNNTYDLSQLDGDFFGAHVNGRFLKDFL